MLEMRKTIKNSSVRRQTEDAVMLTNHDVTNKLDVCLEAIDERVVLDLESNNVCLILNELKVRYALPATGAHEELKDVRSRKAIDFQSTTKFCMLLTDDGPPL